MKCRLIPSLDAPSTSHSTLDRYLERDLIDTRLKHDRHLNQDLNQQLVESWQCGLTRVYQSTLDGMSVKISQSNVDRVSMEMSIKGIDWHLFLSCCNLSYHSLL